MTIESWRLPDCPTCHQPRWELARCECGHLAVSHDLNRANERTNCSHATGPVFTPCPCPGYVQVNHPEDVPSLLREVE